jgi:hypothetical protein
MFTRVNRTTTPHSGTVLLARRYRVRLDTPSQVLL